MPGLLDRIGISLHRVAMDYGVSRAVTNLAREGQYSPILAALSGYRSWTAKFEMETKGIERLRDQHSQSEAPIEYQDFGKGKSRHGPSVTNQHVRRTISDVSNSSAPPHQCRLIYSLVQTIKPATCLELGTCLGISASYIGRALQSNGFGRLHSIEGADVLAELSRDTIRELGLTNVEICGGTFSNVLIDLLPDLQPIDFVFIDGHHEGSAMTTYFKMIEPSISPSGIVLFDDLSWSRSMRRAWTSIRSHERIAKSLDLVTIGICQMKEE